MSIKSLIDYANDLDLTIAQAIASALESGLIGSYANDVEGAISGLTEEQALSVAREDAGLLYIASEAGRSEAGREVVSRRTQLPPTTLPVEEFLVHLFALASPATDSTAELLGE